MTQDNELNAYFEAANQAPPLPDEAFLDRLSLAAQSVTLQFATADALGSFGPWSILRAALGGLPGLVGLSCAVLIGVTFGALPNAGPSITSAWLGTEESWLVDALPDLDTQLELALAGDEL